ncbi:MAG: LysM peptidoglycan-binding domain-containing protein [Chloroflexi bacterium]|nr:LysM peptidoglycan-binding domain-containing protein [Chloroflexota bacterium]
MTQTKIQLPYRSQWDEDADDHSSDCGPTCVAMLLNGKRVAISPNELYKYIGYRPKFTYISDLKNAAWGAGQMTLTYKKYAGSGDALRELRRNIDNGFAFIALAKYKPWVKITGNKFEYGHFLVVTGYDETHVYVHDPLFGLWAQRSRGEYFRFSNKQFLDGWGGFHYTENDNFGCLIPDFNFRFVDDGSGDEEETAVSPTPSPAAKEAEEARNAIAVDGQLRRRILALAAYEGIVAPDLDDAETAVYWHEHVADWGKEIKTHTVVHGNTYSGISRRYYNDSLRWRAIQVYNNQSTAQLYVGQRLEIPLPDSDAEKEPGPRTAAISYPKVKAPRPQPI